MVEKELTEIIVGIRQRQEDLEAKYVAINSLISGELKYLYELQLKALNVELQLYEFVYKLRKDEKVLRAAYKKE